MILETALSDVRQWDPRLGAFVVRSGRIRVEVDLDHLIDSIAFHALANKTGSAVLLGGRIRATVIDRTTTLPGQAASS